MLQKQRTQAPSSTRLMQSSAYGILGIVIDAEFALDNVSKRFRIGVALQFHTLNGQRSAQLPCIFDDSVMDDDNLSLSGFMWVCIVIRNASMGGPPGMRNASCTGYIIW